MTTQQCESMHEGTLVIDSDFQLAQVSDRLFGAFVEHLGRCVYTGIYEPEHQLADEDGFRTDVMDMVRELGVTTIRYPGGNFVSGYRWKDGVGPRQNRPCRLDLAWHSTETNQFGLHEMARWVDRLGGNELMEAVNLGTQGVQEALDLLEYCNIPSGTALSDWRRQNGAEDPFGIRMWCLGNEMDGPWQLGHRNAEDYARTVSMTAAAMRRLDPDIELVACGSSSHGMPTFGNWERSVLRATYEQVDYLSSHAYYHPIDGDMASFLASGVDMGAFIDDVSAIIDATQAELKSDHQIGISFDEWNVWYQDSEASQNPEGIRNWPVAPRLLEDIYNLADAVVFGDLLITLIQHADRVRSASLAQLVNVIAPIMTEPGGPVWRQTTFYPFSVTARLAKGGTVLQTHQECNSYETALYGQVSELNSVTVSRLDGSLVVFVVNRSQTSSYNFSIRLPGGFTCSQVQVSTLHDDNIYAQNTLNDQSRIQLYVNNNVQICDGGSAVSVQLPPVSWTVIHMSPAASI
ncbi:alpha-N-arabinofuranosidase [Bombiscardovia coagulans]|uniref:non-reducing end alpha-L-arabinofuranosidase n=1 Tax=Bombiscardovia coagulans TaxID=686666 RepID=A0A261EQM7_9BIFI|nr:alpha-L-arabinofuranosidase C-terminal domain-containing protein [Bombiscardovia coagulans]OZG49153.1 alpha-L-arabinofuranosidase [Bombiscardovia coagulans]